MPGPVTCSAWGNLCRILTPASNAEPEMGVGHIGVTRPGRLLVPAGSSAARKHQFGTYKELL